MASWSASIKQKGHVSQRGLLYSGSPTWTRTRDLRINSPSLYQLSYQGKEAVLYLPTVKLARVARVFLAHPTCVGS